MTQTDVFRVLGGNDLYLFYCVLKKRLDKRDIPTILVDTVYKLKKKGGIMDLGIENGIKVEYVIINDVEFSRQLTKRGK